LHRRAAVAAPQAFGSFALAPTLVPFMKRYPEVAIHLSLSDHVVDLVNEGIDVAIRVGSLNDSGLHHHYRKV
jgi:DNA-binding transcriptional LysR family regulator